VHFIKPMLQLLMHVCLILSCIKMHCVVLFCVLFVSSVFFCVLFVSSVLFCVLFVCKFVLYYCHQVSTQLQLNIYHITYH
jgi:hypothetical protein